MLHFMLQDVEHTYHVLQHMYHALQHKYHVGKKLF